MPHRFLAFPSIAPEVLKDLKISKASDVYCLGVIMFELWHNMLVGGHSV